MSIVTSADGTTIAYTVTGSGPPLILVDGALCSRSFGPAKSFAEQLKTHFTVYTYDRRGRGGSGDTPPYAVEREAEDLAALIKETGGPAHVFGQSSGGAIALDAANSGVPISKLAVYEIPFAVTDNARFEPEGYHAGLTKALAENRRGDAVKMFWRNVGVPGFFVTIAPLLPAWSKLKSVAHTLPYDRACLEGGLHGRPLPADRYLGVTAPTLAMAGGKSDEWFRDAMRQVTDRLPVGEYRTIDGQSHLLKAKAIAPVLKEYFAA